MEGSFLGAMNSMGGRSEFSSEEIDKARKRQKKHGGTLMENLEAVTGRAPSGRNPFGDMGDMSAKARELQQMTEELAGRSAQAANALDAIGQGIAADQEALNREIRELNRNLAQDFGVGPGAVSAGTAQADMSGTAQKQPLSAEQALEAFRGIAENIGEQVYGQTEFLKKLVIAFKRPYVMPPEDSRARNVILITGREDTGRHYGLRELAGILAERGIIKNGTIRTVDLAIYPEASMEQVFLQDIYAALSSDAEIILFEHPEGCHASFLTQISSLVTEGSMRLSGRYVMQKGQLVNVQNSLASDAVSSLSAAGKYLVFLTEKSLDKVAGIMGAAFVDALQGDVCQTEQLEQDAITKIAEREQEELKKRAAEQCFFELTFDDGFSAYGAGRAGRNAGVRGVLDFYGSVLQALAQARLERDYEKGKALTLSVSDGKLIADAGDETIDLSSLLPEDYRGEIDEIRSELDAIIGLTEVKKYILSLEEYYSVQKRREAEGLKTGEVNKHMIFTGSPGTGKTTIARIISKYLKAIGVLSGGQLVEVSRADLVGRYVGHTAPLTNQVIKSAIGGVLFIDEAYSLYRGQDDTFGLEAIDTLVKGIEDNRDDLIVILAGYSIEMREFLTANSGLKSRFPNIIDFPDYTGEELMAIARSIASSKGYTIDPAAEETLIAYFDTVQAIRAADAGNGRFARNLVEEAILNQSRRLVAEPEAELSLLTLKDFDLEQEESAE